MTTFPGGCTLPLNLLKLPNFEAREGPAYSKFNIFNAIAPHPPDPVSSKFNIFNGIVPPRPEVRRNPSGCEFREPYFENPPRDRARVRARPSPANGSPSAAQSPRGRLTGLERRLNISHAYPMAKKSAPPPKKPRSRKEPAKKGPRKRPVRKKPPPVKKPGRPSAYTQEIAELICEGISAGFTLKQLREKFPALPSTPTVYRWLDEHPEFRDAYTRSRRIRAEGWADRLAQIGAVAVRDAKALLDTGGAGPIISAHKLDADALKWLIARHSPAEYAEPVSIDVREDDSRRWEKVWLARWKAALDGETEDESQVPPGNRTLQQIRDFNVRYEACRRRMEGEAT